jgi:hypothetical protein
MYYAQSRLSYHNHFDEYFSQPLRAVYFFQRILQSVNKLVLHRLLHFTIQLEAAAFCCLLYSPKIGKSQKTKLKGRHFDTIEVIEAESQVVPNTLTEYNFQRAFKKCQKR